MAKNHADSQRNTAPFDKQKPYYTLPGFKVDAQLAYEMARLHVIITELSPHEGVPVVSPELFQTILMGLLISDRAIEENPNDKTFYLMKNYKRTFERVVELYHACECAYRYEQQGRDRLQILIDCIEPENWNPPEPLQHDLKPLVRKFQRQVFNGYPEVRRMKLDVFWLVARYRLLADGVIIKHMHS